MGQNGTGNAQLSMLGDRQVKNTQNYSSQQRQKATRIGEQGGSQLRISITVAIKPNNI